MKEIMHYIAGSEVSSRAPLQEVFNPALGEAVARLHMGSELEVNQAVDSAKCALQHWKILSPLKRSRLLFRYYELLNQHRNELAHLIMTEHGKVVEDALGEVQRGIEIVEFACGMPYLLKGEHSHQVASGVDAYSIRQSLGVCVGITPFNFPCMVPLWMFPIALACGNTFVLKPSERDPSVVMRLAELLFEAGFPQGVLNVVHGDQVVVEALLHHPDVAAVSFVGSTPVAKHIYATAAAEGKRVQALGGAKNHCVVMPDANFDEAVNGLMGAAFGSAGERCMAISVAVVVGDEQADRFVAAMKSKIEKLKVAAGNVKGAQMGPVITRAHQESIESYVDGAEKAGATLVTDGRNYRCDGYEKGFFVGPTLLDHVKPSMKVYQDEVFGPVLCVVRVGSLNEAIALINHKEVANGTSIYTSDGAAARKFSDEIEVGMVGVNVPIPVPMAFHSFGGWKASSFGGFGMHGEEGVRFYTRMKTITTKWLGSELSEDSHFYIPTLS